MSLSSMSRNPASAIVRRAMLALAAFGAACSDHITSAPARVLGSSDRVVTCQGDVGARTLSCGMSSAPTAVRSPSGFSADLIVGGENNDVRSEEHTSELQSRPHLVCRLLLEKKKTQLLEPHCARQGQRTAHGILLCCAHSRCAH